jgi:predicted RNA-binding protein
VRGEGENAYYEYSGKKLEDLDVDTLLILLRKGNSILSLEILQKLDQQQRQLRNLKQVQDMQRTQQMLRQQSTTGAHSQPKTRIPPSVPKTKY